VLKLVTEPNRRLHASSETIKEFGPELMQLGELLKALCVQSKGVGIAAPQVGLSLQVAVIKPWPKKPGHVIVNPYITKSSGSNLLQESCLSIPGKTATVKRAKKITVKYQTINGATRTIRVEGQLARIYQHEIDHLNGILYTDKLYITELEAIENGEQQ
tara:strand:- start:133 stop:609 length:477 start_codon:yes stop_codon:yes gene_type:complete